MHVSFPHHKVIQHPDNTGDSFPMTITNSGRKTPTSALFCIKKRHITETFGRLFFTAPLVVFDFNFQIPKLWAYLAGNLVTQYICIRSVYVLTSECASLTVTLVVTLRKFMSLMFSIFYFQNPFTLYHWFGTVLVFGGTLIFVELASKIREALLPKKETKTE